jgi:NhaA family Na+:H+ antiporter
MSKNVRSFMHRPRLVGRFTRPFERFGQLEAASSIVLLAMTLIALVWANSPFHDSYEHLKHRAIFIGAGDLALSLSFEEWVNDALMTIFFFVVGMEIKRELALGQLSTRSRAMLPVLGALGGMVFPAAIYAGFHAGGPAIRGWGIPMATDIAFAVAALAVFGSRVPSGLKIFLLALAIVDDLGAVAVIAVFYTSDLSLAWLAQAVLGLALVYLVRLAGVRSYWVFALIGAVVWLAMLKSGVHATVSGVMLGLLCPSRPQDPQRETWVSRAQHSLEHLLDLSNSERDHGGHERHRALQRIKQVRWSTLSPLDHLTNVLHPWVAFGIMPIFALTNAGVALEASTLSDPMAQRVGLAVALGLLLGKPIGITCFSFAAVRLGIAELPRGVNWASMFATGILAGIGFTVALFISALAFSDLHFMAGAKIGILSGSALATTIGVFVLSRALPRTDATKAPRQV